MTIWGYCRVSSEEQASGGISLTAQKNALIKSGVPEKNIFTDGGRSGGVKEDRLEYVYDGRFFKVIIDLDARPEFQKMLQQVKAGDIIRYLKNDRISRNITFMHSFHHHCQREKFLLEPIDDTTDRLTRNILTVISEEELHKTRSRNDSIHKSLYDRGLWAYRPPSGYQKNIRQTDGTLKYADLPEGCLVIDPEKVEMIKDMFKMMAEGKYYKDLCDKYQISNRQLYDVIRNRTYLGEAHYQDQWKKSEHIPQIINEQTFKKANENIKTKEKMGR
jgi:DNA invertase Pin-like site-specific DNA recombinase